MTAFVMSVLLAGLEPGVVAPDVSALNQDGRRVKLSDFPGRPVLIFFYPKDDTPGCTKEACALRDAYSRYQELGIVILGVSRQSPESHRAFKAKHHLPFDLLSDEDGSFSRAFGVKAIPVVGWLKRQSVLLDASHKVARFFDDVDPAKHAAEVLAVVQQRQAAHVR